MRLLICGSDSLMLPEKLNKNSSDLFGNKKCFPSSVSSSSLTRNSINLICCSPIERANHFNMPPSCDTILENMFCPCIWWHQPWMFFSCITLFFKSRIVILTRVRRAASSSAAVKRTVKYPLASLPHFLFSLNKRINYWFFMLPFIRWLHLRRFECLLKLMLCSQSCWCLESRRNACRVASSPNTHWRTHQQQMFPCILSAVIYISTRRNQGNKVILHTLMGQKHLITWYIFVFHCFHHGNNKISPQKIK